LAISQSQRAHDTQLHLLFAKGRRPDSAAISSFAARQQANIISNQPFAKDPAQPAAVWPGQQLWIELLREGLTFDLSGLGPGPQSDFPQIEHRFDLPNIPTPETHEALAFLPGPHLVAGGRSQPVVRAMLALACDLILHFDDLVAIGWGPSRSAIGRRFFESVISAWLDGGPFPALGLTAFTENPDGALESLGLAFWTGQELRIEPPLSFEKVAATRLGIRLVNQLVLAGSLNADERIIAPDGTRLVLRPSADQTLISVVRE
jgi:hypothetical protein